MQNSIKKLDARLQMVADMVPGGSTLVDVGTDHGWLPINLVKNGIIPGAIASDLRPGPLSHAQKGVTDAGLAQQIQLRLSDGLDAIEPHEATCVVMAGMGGILITQLIDKAPWLQDATKTLVLQPMTDAPLLRTYLAAHGFSLVCERATADKNHCYTVMKAVYNGVKRDLTPLQALVGKLDDPLGANERRFLEKEQQRLVKQIKGLRAAGKEGEAAPALVLYDDVSKVIQGGVFR